MLFYFYFLTLKKEGLMIRNRNKKYFSTLAGKDRKKKPDLKSIKFRILLEKMKILREKIFIFITILYFLILNLPKATAKIYF